MLIQAALETNLSTGRTIAWALNVPGCATVDAQAASALIRLPQAVLAFADWANRHAGESWLEPGNLDIRLSGVWTSQPQGQPGLTAWFDDDAHPLNDLELRRGLDCLRWGRTDLLAIITGLDADRLNRRSGPAGDSIQAVLARLAAAELGILSRLSAAPQRAAAPPDLAAQMDGSRQRLEDALSAPWPEDSPNAPSGERWSQRKLLRTAIWNEREAIGQILALY